MQSVTNICSDNSRWRSDTVDIAKGSGLHVSQKLAMKLFTFVLLVKLRY